MPTSSRRRSRSSRRWARTWCQRSERSSLRKCRTLLSGRARPGRAAQCASKTSLEVARQESQSTEQRLRTSPMSRSRLVAQELVVQGLEARIAAMESATKASELKAASEISAVHAQFSQLSAAIERQRGEAEARVNEASSRASASHDSILAQLGQAADERARIAERMATRPELAEAQAGIGRRFAAAAGEHRRARPSGCAGCRRRWRACRARCSG